VLDFLLWRVREVILLPGQVLGDFAIIWQMRNAGNGDDSP